MHEYFQVMNGRAVSFEALCCGTGGEVHDHAASNLLGHLIAVYNNTCLTQSTESVTLHDPCDTGTRGRLPANIHSRPSFARCEVLGLFSLPSKHCCIFFTISAFHDNRGNGFGFGMRNHMSERASRVVAAKDSLPLLLSGTVDRSCPKLKLVADIQS
jgi:hypothetical protein